jgi:PAS domain S-box-containing protein
VSIKGGTILYTCRDITERKRAQQVMLESEERYRQLFNSESDAVMIFDSESNQFEDANPATLELFGYSKREFVRLKVEDISAEIAKTKDAVEKVKNGDPKSGYVSLRYFKKKNGAIFPGEIYAGTFVSKGRKKIIGAVRDISERMQSEEEIRKLSFNLLTAQEMERKRIAYELHDDIGQTLAILKLQLENIHNKLPETQDMLKDEFKNSLKYANEIIEKIRKLSHGLSPSILDYLGLTFSLRSLADDFSQYSHINMRTDIVNIDSLFSPIDQITIYRIFQEIFTNIEKHSEAADVKIDIRKSQTNVTFQIEDDGRGFDIKKVELKYPNEIGLGLASMEERVRMLGGRFEVQSQLNKGTKISFTIPF